MLGRVGCPGLGGDQGVGIGMITGAGEAGPRLLMEWTPSCAGTRQRVLLARACLVEYRGRQIGRVHGWTW